MYVWDEVRETGRISSVKAKVKDRGVDQSSMRDSRLVQRASG